MNPGEWSERGEGTNALATATKAAQSDRRHVIRSVHASYSAAGIGLLQVKRGTTVVFERYVHNADSIPLDLRGNVGEAVSAELAAGGAGVVGKVDLVGYTI